MNTASYGWIEAALRYTGRFGAREKMTYQEIFQISAPSVSRHQQFVANAMEEASDTPLFLKNNRGHFRGGKLALLDDAVLPSATVFARVPNLEHWLHDTFSGVYFHKEQAIRDQPAAEIVRPVITALVDNTPLRIQYHSRNGLIRRTISPHVIVEVAGRLHLRAFDHEKNGHRDYVLSRIDSVRKVEDGNPQFIGNGHDKDWQNYVTVEIKEKTNCSDNETQAIRKEYSLKEDGARAIKVREALAHYVIDIEDRNFESPVQVILQSR